MINKIKGTFTSSLFVVLALVILSLWVLTPMVSMIILGAIFAYAIRPISAKLLHYLKFETVSIILSMILLLLPIFVILAIVINSIIETAPAIAGVVKSANITSISSTTVQQYPLVQQYVPPEYQTYITSLFNSLNAILSDIFRRLLNYLVETLSSIPSLGFQLFIFFASAFYFVKDGDKLWNYLKSVIPEHRSHFFRNLVYEIENVVKSIFLGHFLTATIIGLFAIAGFYLLGYPYALFMGVLAGFLQLIPIIGPWPTYAVYLILDVLDGNYLRAVIVLLFGVFLSGVDVYIRPKISGKYADVHPLIFLLGFLCGPIVFGLVGFILGPLILGVTYAAIVAYRKESDDVKMKRI